MRKLFIISAIFVLGVIQSIFPAARHLDANSQVYFVGQSTYIVPDDGYDRDFSISFDNLIGYETEQMAREEENGQLIGIQCYLSYRQSTMVQTKWVNLLNRESTGKNWFVRQQEPFYSVKSIDGKIESVPKPVEIVNLKPLGCEVPLEDIAEGHVEIDQLGVKGVNLGVRRELAFVLNNPNNSRASWFERLFAPTLSPKNALWVESAEFVANSLCKKDTYSVADTIAIYIAFGLVRDAYKQS